MSSKDSKESFLLFLSTKRAYALEELVNGNDDARGKVRLIDEITASLNNSEALSDIARIRKGKVK